MIKKLIQKILSWINRKTELWKIRRMWAKTPKKVYAKYKPEVLVSFQKPKWISAEKGTMPNASGRYIVRHKGRLREAIFKMIVPAKPLKCLWNYQDLFFGFVIDHRDTVPMKGVTAWYLAPENLIKIW
jgi:hypothetical protein